MMDMTVDVYLCIHMHYYGQAYSLWENDHMSPELSGFLLQAVEFETSVHASGSQELSMFTESHAGHQTRVIYKRHGKETNKKKSAQNILTKKHSRHFT